MALVLVAGIAAPGGALLGMAPPSLAATVVAGALSGTMLVMIVRYGCKLKAWAAASSLLAGLLFLSRFLLAYPLSQQIIRDHRFANRERATECRVLEIDPTRHPFPEHHERVVQFTESGLARIGVSPAPGKVTFTGTVLVDRRRVVPTGSPLNSFHRLYRLDPSDLDGFVIPSEMVLSEHACPAAVQCARASAPDRPSAS